MMGKTLRHSHEEHEEETRLFEAERVRSMERRLLHETETELASLANREQRRIETLLTHGFDIGTRQQAIDRTGPYADEANQDRVTLFYLEHGVGTQEAGPIDG